MASLVGEQRDTDLIGPLVYLIRHGETSWSANGQHTSYSEILLTFGGEQQAHRTGALLRELRSSVVPPALVLSSPRQRAVRTAELAGLIIDETDEELTEWDYGDYEGLTTKQIREKVPDWLVWTHGCPGGESPQQVSDRADRAIAYALDQMESRDVLFVGHGHFSRAMVTRWVELNVSEGIRFAMVAASIAVCGFEHGVRQISALGLTGHRHPCLPA